MQTAAMNQQHATPTLGHRLLNESLGLVSGRIRGQVMQVQFSLGHDLAARERPQQIVGHAKGRTGQLVTILFYVQRFPRRPRPRDRGRRRLHCLPLRHSAPGPRRQRPHTLHGGLEKPAIFFLGRTPAFG
jgi:hypothetical protein